MSLCIGQTCWVTWCGESCFLAKGCRIYKQWATALFTLIRRTSRFDEWRALSSEWREYNPKLFIWSKGSFADIDNGCGGENEGLLEVLSRGEELTDQGICMLVSCNKRIGAYISFHCDETRRRITKYTSLLHQPRTWPLQLLTTESCSHRRCLNTIQWNNLQRKIGNIFFNSTPPQLNLNLRSH